MIAIGKQQYCTSRTTLTYLTWLQFQNNTWYWTRQVQNLGVVYWCDSQFSRKLPLYNFPMLWNRHWGDNMLDQMSHSMLKRLVKSNFIDGYVEVNLVNCQNPPCRDCGSAQWFWALLLIFFFNDDLIFHYVCLSLEGLVPNIAQSLSTSYLCNNLITISFLEDYNENRFFGYLQSISSYIILSICTYYIICSP